MAKLTLNDAFDRNCYIDYSIRPNERRMGRYMPNDEGKINMVGTVRHVLKGNIYIQKIEIIDWLPILKLLQQEKLIDNEGRITL